MGRVSQSGGRRTSFSKLALVNSSEFKSALVAANRTLLLGSSFRMPCTIAVRISLDWLARNFGSYSPNTRTARQHTHMITTYQVFTDVANSIQGGLFQLLRALGSCHIVEKRRDQLWPGVDLQLCRCQVGHTLGSCTELVHLCTQRTQDLRGGEGGVRGGEGGVRRGEGGV